ncbi:unnamed protein product, partial [Symbiodinium sp. CCMP2456]
EASEDLKKCLGKPHQTVDTKSKKKRARDKKKEKETPPPPRKKAKREKKLFAKEEPKEEPKEESDDEGEKDCEGEEPAVPTPPSDAESASEAEPEAEAEAEDSNVDSGDFDECDDDDDDDDDDDEDVFAGDFKVIKKAPSREQLLETLPPSLASQQSKLEDGLIAAIPQDLTKSDFDSWIAVLLKEQMFSLDEVKECRGLDGPLSSHLSVSKKYFKKLSIKGKKLFDTWVDSLRFPDKDAPLSTPSGRRPSAAKVIAVKFVRPQHLYKVLPECLTMFLGMTHELNQYALYLRSSPAQSAGLLSSKAEDEAKQAILESMSREWKLVLSLEARPQARALLHQHCGYVLYQQYRETMGFFERSGFKLTRDGTELLQSWFPEVPWSANLESVFGEMQHAVRRTGKADVGSLSNLMSVAIRGLERRVFTDADENPKPLRLVPEDWVGKQTNALKSKMFSPTSAQPCKNVNLDNIAKPFPSTSAFHHTQHSLNFMKGLLEADRQGLSPVAASTSFWVPNCFSAGTLLQKDNTFFLSTGKTPGRLYAVQLKELPWLFSGKLPARQMDEKCMPASNTGTVADVLGAGQATKALCLDVGRTLMHQFLLKTSEVQLFEYTVHLAPKGVEDKCGCGFLLRRGVKSYGLVAYLVHTLEILKLHSATISEILFEADIRLPKNTSKGLKIRRVLEMDSVKNHVSEGTIASIQKILDEQDEKRKQNKDQKQETEQNEEDSK